MGWSATETWALGWGRHFVSPLVFLGTQVLDLVVLFFVS
jgi:hypothetical protein